MMSRIVSVLKSPRNKNCFRILLLSLFVLFSNSCKREKGPQADLEKGIAIHDQNPFYWSYQGLPVLLLGATDDDNLFQMQELQQHLELLKSVGGNYIRCTMSSRDEGNIKPYLKDENGSYDLENFNPEYWDRFRSLLEISKSLDIIVQVEVWATYDFYWGERNWQNNPFNPGRNSNYSATEIGLPDSIAYPAQQRVNPFFRSVPELDDNAQLLRFQQSFVNQLLGISLEFDNVLYCVDNETNAPYPWGQYWSKYLKKAAEQAGKSILVTEMWDGWDPTNGAVANAKMQHPDLGGWYAEYTNPELHENSNFSFSLRDTLNYDFLDVSNNNSQDGQTHYDTALWVRTAVENSGKYRPINNVKIYGANPDQLWSGTPEEAQHRFWRNIFAGHASSRFHRPDAGIGLSRVAAKNLESMRKLTDSVDFFSFKPANQLMSERRPNAAYLMSNDKGDYLAYFPNGGVVRLNIPAQNYRVRKLRVERSYWLDPETIAFPGVLAMPHGEAWAVILEAQ